MKYLPAFTLVVLFYFPAFAWSCGFNQAPTPVYALDFLMLGVAVGTGFRLFIQPFTKMSEELGASIFISCLFASLGVGLFYTHNPGWGFGLFAVGALMLAPFGAAYPKSRVLRVLVLGPTFFVACVAVRHLHLNWVRSGAEPIVMMF